MTRGEVVGLPTLAEQEGRTVGRVADLLCAPTADRVIGLLLEGGRRGRHLVVPYEEVAAIGPAAVMLRRAVVFAPRTGPRLAALRPRADGLVGRRILTRDGRDLGEVRDFAFEPATGRVTGYVVSGGVFQDLLEGRKLLPADARITLGGSTLIVDIPHTTPGTDGNDGSHAG